MPAVRWTELGTCPVKGKHMNRNLPRVAYRPREAAEVTGLSLRFLYYAIQQKDLPTIRVGRCRLITEKALREWLERKTVPPADSQG
jgi:excisionase family DNA binding protein